MSAGSPASTHELRAADLYRVSIAQYHRMIEAGILDENDHVQLLEGVLVGMSPIGTPHSTCVTLLARVLNERIPASRHVRVQQPVMFEMSEPEPELSVVRGSIRDFAARHPSSSELDLVVEVAETSLATDRETKLRIYAAAGVGEYWIVDLNSRRVEVYRDPLATSASAAYGSVDRFTESQRVPLQIEGADLQEIAVSSFLP